MQDQKTASVVVDNVRHGDAGDSTIIGCEFWPSSKAIASVIQYASGGLRLIGNKLGGGSTLDTEGTNFGYLLHLQDRPFHGGPGTGILNIQGGSFEHHDIASICIINNSPNIFYSITIVGSQIRGGIVINKPVYGNEYLSHITISANVILGQKACANSAVAIGGGNIVNITGNTIDGRNIVDYGILAGSGTIYQSGNIIVNTLVSKTVGVFQEY